MNVFTERSESSDLLSMVWRALADPTRRQILDHLRSAPMTTGDIVQALSHGRCAVMKHLDVLTNADLVTVRRDGRKRWNHLNVVPLQRMHEHWVRPYEALWATRLHGVACTLDQTPSAVETAVTTPSIAPSATPPSAGLLTVQLEISYNARRDRVWNMLTERVDRWWPREFFASPTPARMRFEPQLGGRLIEEAANGGGVVWYTVYGLTPGVAIDMVGHLSAAFGGPAQSLLRLALREDDGRTVLTLTDAIVGNVGPNSAAANEAGWRTIFADGLKRFVERDADGNGRPM